MNRLKRALVYQQKKNIRSQQQIEREWKAAEADGSLGKAPKWFPKSDFFQAICDLFIYPLLIIDEWRDFDFVDRIEYILHRKDREIFLATVIQTFNLPGRVWLAGEYRRPLTTEAHCPYKSSLFIRVDATMPDRIDIERADQPDIFMSLTREEYKSIVPYIKVITNRKRL